MSTKRPLHKWTNEQIARFWDHESQFPERYWSNMHGKRIARRFKSQIKRSKKILDYRCGDGSLIRQLAAIAIENDTTFMGYENSEATNTVIEKKLGEIKQYSGRISNTTLHQHLGEFDIIFCCEVVEHLYDNELNEALNNIHKLLKRTGKLILTTPNNEDLTRNLICNPIDGSLFHRWQHVRSWTDSEISKRLGLHGFVNIKTECCNPRWWQGHNITKSLYYKLTDRTRPSLLCIADKLN